MNPSFRGTLVQFLVKCYKLNREIITFINSEQVNREIVKIQRVNAPVGQMQLKSLIEAHVVSATN